MVVNSLDELYSVLNEGMVIPGTYLKFDEEHAPGLPFFVYFSDGDESFYADDTNYAEMVRVFIELYTRDRDDLLEKRMESILRDNEITYTKEVDFVEDEDCYMITYKIYFVEG